MAPKRPIELKRVTMGPHRLSTITVICPHWVFLAKQLLGPSFSHFKRLKMLKLRPPRGVRSDVLTKSQQLSIIKVTIDIRVFKVYIA